MKHILKSFTLLCVIALLLCACGKTQSTGDVSMYDLNSAMSSASDKFQEMKYVSSEDGDPENLFSNISDMDYTKVNAFFISYAADGAGNADELAVIQVKNASDIGDAASSLNEHLEKRRALYATYDKSQTQKLDNGIIVSYGDVAALIVADDIDTIKDAFYSYFE